METIVPEINERADSKVSQHSAVLHAKLVESAGHLKAWFAKEMITFNKSVYDRLEKN